MYVYKTTCLINGKIYIGQSNKCHIKNHWYLGSGTLIKRAVSKYGRINFSIEVLKVCTTQNLLNAWEQIYIKIYNSTDISIGYNILKKDIGDHSKGVKRTKAEKENLRIKLTGMKRSKQNKRNLSLSKKGILNPNYGKTFTAEERAKFGLKGEKHPLYGLKLIWWNNGERSIRLKENVEPPKGFVRGSGRSTKSC